MTEKTDLPALIARVGPRETVKRSCYDCSVCKSERYAVQGDSGHDVYCTHPFVGRKHIADTSWTTPDWCPALPPAAPLLADECDRLQASLEHTQYWYSVRLEHLHRWAHTKLSAELRTEYFSIVANGHEDGAPPTYAQKMNVLSHARDKADAECSRLQERVRALEADYEDGGAATNRELARRLLAAEKRVRVLEVAMRPFQTADGHFAWCRRVGLGGVAHHDHNWDNGNEPATACSDHCWTARAALEGTEVE